MVSKSVVARLAFTGQYKPKCVGDDGSPSRTSVGSLQGSLDPLSVLRGKENNGRE